MNNPTDLARNTLLTVAQRYRRTLADSMRHPTPSSTTELEQCSQALIDAARQYVTVTDSTRSQRP